MRYGPPDVLPVLTAALATLSGMVSEIRPPPPPPIPPPVVASKPRAKALPKTPRSRVRRTGPATGSPPSVEQWRPLVEAVGLPVEWALRTLRCESRGNADAVSRNGKYRGLFQIEDGPLDPESNARIAAEMYRRRGRQPWLLCG